MTTIDDVRSAMVAAFAEIARDHPPWPDPHPGMTSPAEEEYSRVTDPEKYRIAAARIRAWTSALEQNGIALREAIDEIVWHEGTRTPVLTSCWRIAPTRSGTVPLVVGLTRFDEHVDVGLVLGVGSPPINAAVVPDCGCDACDIGSERLLEQIDDLVVDVATGSYVHRSRGAEYVALRSDGWGGSARFLHRLRPTGGWEADRDAVLAATSTWHDISGASWLEPA